MPAVGFAESVVEEAALRGFAEIGYDSGHGPDLEPGGMIEAWATLSDVIFRPRLLDALRRINPGVPEVNEFLAVNQVTVRMARSPGDQTSSSSSTACRRR